MRLASTTSNGIQTKTQSFSDATQATAIKFPDLSPARSTTAIAITGMTLRSKHGGSKSWSSKWKRTRRRMRLKRKENEE